MRKLIPVILCLALVGPAKAQLWFDAGVNAAWGPTLMYDQNVFDDGDYKHKASFGNSFGGRLGVNFGYHAGISLEYNAATSNQDFNYNGQEFNSFQWKHNDLATLFRYSGNGAYVEVGGKYSNMKEVTLESVESQYNLGDVTDKFSDDYFSGIFGFGSYLMGSELLTLNLGIRLHWGFNDIVNEAGKADDYPILVKPLDDPSKKTLATAAQLRFELNYAFGRFSKEACHDRWRLILFQ
jgi:hypothetical protein